MNFISLDTFRQTAQIASDDKTIKLSGDSLTSTGKLGTFFTFNSTNRATMAAFVDAIKYKYGDYGAQLACNHLAGDYAAGKPLTAFTVRQVMGEVVTENPEVTQNEFLTSAFIRGENLIQDQDSKPIPTKFSLDKSVDQYVEEQIQKDPELYGPKMTPEFKERLKAGIAVDLHSGRLRFNDLQEMHRAVTTGQVGGLQQVLEMEVHGGHHRLSGLAGSLEDKCQLAALMHFSPGQGSSLQAVSNGLNLWDKRLSPSQGSLLQVEGNFEFAVRNLPKMRELQPTGPLEPKTIWRACLGEAPDAAIPDGIQSNPKAILTEINNRISAKILTYLNALPEKPTGDAGKYSISNHQALNVALNSLPFEAIETGRARKPVETTCSLPTENFDVKLSKNMPGQAAQDSPLARCLSDNFALSRACSGAPVVFTFVKNEDGASPSQTAITMNKDDITGSPQQVVAIMSAPGESNAKTFIANFKQALSDFGGKNMTAAQENAIIRGMGQNGNFVLRRLETAIGLPLDSSRSASSAYSFELSHGDNGDVHLRHIISDVNPGSDGQPVKIPRSELTMVIRPDGSMNPNAAVKLNQNQT